MFEKKHPNSLVQNIQKSTKDHKISRCVKEGLLRMLFVKLCNKTCENSELGENSEPCRLNENSKTALSDLHKKKNACM